MKVVHAKSQKWTLDVDPLSFTLIVKEPMMTFPIRRSIFAVGILCAALAGQTQRSQMKFSHALPKLDGAHLQVKVVEVRYEAGGSSAPHSHPCPVIGHVLEGAVRMQVKGEPEATYKAGESFYEAPNGVHLVSANASDKEPARFLAYFVCDRETPVTVPASH
jgi:quercetin dioxygenase-like cupin family protein